MNTRQRTTRSSFGSPQPKQTSTVMTPPSSTSPVIKAEPSSQSVNSSVSLNNSSSSLNTLYNSPIPRGLMTRDGTPASSTTRLHSDLRINPLRIVPALTPVARPSRATVTVSGVTTRGGAVKRQFKPKLPAINDPKKNDAQNKIDVTADDTNLKQNDERNKIIPGKRNGTIDTRRPKQIVQTESSVFTGSAGVLKPLRGMKPSLSFGPSSSTTVIGSKASGSSTKETIKVACDGKVSVSQAVIKDDYDSDRFVVSDDESDDDTSYGGSKKKYSTTKPFGYDCLHSQIKLEQRMKKKIKIEKDIGTEFNESFVVKPATDVFMKFLSLQQVNYNNSMIFVQVSDELLATESVRNPDSLELNQELSQDAPSDDSDMINNYIGRLRMYQSGKVEIVKPGGRVYEVTRTGNENIHVPSSLPKVMFKARGVNEQEYAMQSNAGTVNDRDCPKYHVVKMDLKYREELNEDTLSSASSPFKSDREVIGGTLTEIAHLDPREDLIATPVICGEAKTDEETCDGEDEEGNNMDCDS